MIVGFNSSEYNANEEDGTLEITVGLLFGKLRSEIALSLEFSIPTDGKYHTHKHAHRIYYLLTTSTIYYNY